MSMREVGQLQREVTGIDKRAEVSVIVAGDIENVFDAGGESFCGYRAYTYPFVRYLKSVPAVFSPAIAVEGEN